MTLLVAQEAPCCVPCWWATPGVPVLPSCLLRDRPRWRGSVWPHRAARHNRAGALGWHHPNFPQGLPTLCTHTAPRHSAALCCFTVGPSDTSRAGSSPQFPARTRNVFFPFNHTTYSKPHLNDDINLTCACLTAARSDEQRPCGVPCPCTRPRAGGHVTGSSTYHNRTLLPQPVACTALGDAEQERAARVCGQPQPCPWGRAEA